jgi:outer membrane receptor protein involved in Fe transport
MNTVRISLALAGSISLVQATPVQAVTPPPERVQVTATRFGEPVQEVPGSISVVTGEEIRARGATDLRTALSLMAGVSVAPGGDAGPAAAAPSLLGIREVDDLLLLIDGIPTGGAFRPQVEAVSLNNVERIEVLRGAAPVYYGTTAFAGTINVIHYAAGKAESVLSLRVGSQGSAAASGSVVISTGGLRQSISGEVSSDKYSDPRAKAQRAQGSYRLGTEVGGGNLTADLTLLGLRQKPTSPLPVDEATSRLTTLLPIDFSQLPTDAKLDTDRAQLTLAYELPLSFGRWGNTLSYTDTTTHSALGYIDMVDTPPQPWTHATEASVEGFRQKLHLRDLFVDSHITSRPMAGLDLTAGVNLLLGRANANSSRQALSLVLDGVSQTPPTTSIDPKQTVDFNDRREFWGLYAQTRYQLSPTVSVLAGLRWNKTHESRDETRFRPASGELLQTATQQDINRMSGSVGAQWSALKDGQGALNALTLHASLGSTFQPAQLSFSPNPEVGPEGGGLLKPETQRSLVFGLKGDFLGGLAEFDIDAFLVDFNNQPIQTNDGEGNPVLRTGGEQRYKGLDIEGLAHLAPRWTVKANATISDAKYRNFVTDVGGTPTQLEGKSQVLTPKTRLGLGLIYAPERGFRGSLVASHVGQHYLNRMNTAEGATYTLVDASLGYRFDRFTVQLAGTNLGNRRDPVQLSELGEDQFYRLPARRYDLIVTVPFR